MRTEICDGKGNVTTEKTGKKLDSSKLCEFCIFWVFFFKLGDSGESGDFGESG